MQTTTFPRLAVATAIAATFAHAQADDGPDGQQVAALDPVVVTAARTPQTTDELLSATTILEREDIERSQASDVPSLLDRQPGLNVARTGPYGGDSSLFMRGTNSDHTLVLMDGMRIESATAGTAPLEQFPLHDIERIEVVRGPRSSIYGADAIGGVVQMFTRGERMFEGQRVRGGMMAGGNNTTEATAGFDAGDGEREFSISGRKFDTDGIRVRDDSTSRSGFENDSASVRYRQQLNERVQWRANAMHSRGTVEFVGSDPQTFQPRNEFDDFVQQTAATALDIHATDWWQVNLRAGQSKDERDTFAESAPQELVSRFDTTRNEFQWTNELFFTDHSQVITGIDLRDDEIESTAEFDEDSRYNAGAFGVYLWETERTSFEISGRRDKNEAFGYSTTGAVAGGYRIGANTRLRGSIGTAFKAPTFNELYRGTPGFGANPDLEPEESISYEIGIESGRDLRWGINVFRTEIDNLIAIENGTLENIDEATIDGVELFGTATDVDGWRLQGTLTWQDPVAKGQDGEDDTTLLRRPERKLTFDFDRRFDRVSLGGSIRHEGGKRRDIDFQTFETIDVDPFTVIDLRAGYQLTPYARLRGSIENVTNTDYQTVDGFNTLDRTYFLRLDFTT